MLPSLDEFANLLERLETNGKPRLAEAHQMRERAAVLRSLHTEMLPDEAAASSSGGQRNAWLGAEPWYLATFEIDWLGSCVE